MVRRERFINDTQTTLNGAINDTTTTIVVTDGTSFPSDGDYRLLIEDEVVVVTKRVAQTLTVVRGVDGTTAASHVDTLAIRTVLTAEALAQWSDDIAPAYSDHPAHRLLNLAGNTITSSALTWVNQGGAAVADETWGAMTFTLAADVGVNLRCMVRSALTTPYLLTAHMAVGPGGGSNTLNGLIFRETTSSRLIGIAQRPGDEYYCYKYDNVTTFNSEAGSGTVNCMSQSSWFQIEDDGVNLYFRISQNGVQWFERFTEPRGTFFTTAPDEFGIFFNSDNGFVNQLHHVTAWLES